MFVESLLLSGVDLCPLPSVFYIFKMPLCFPFQVVGSIESPLVVVDGGGDVEMEAKKPGDAEKAKPKKLYAGVQALGYRRDHMDVNTSQLTYSFCNSCRCLQSFKFENGILWQMIVLKYPCV